MLLLLPPPSPPEWEVPRWEMRPTAILQNQPTLSRHSVSYVHSQSRGEVWTFLSSPANQSASAAMWRAHRRVAPDYPTMCRAEKIEWRPEPKPKKKKT
mmetsp:Transcript_70196/g.146886  ORF Transcript_70196/g.146886 Transcript_70196/m.146886 type:complete len:98 (+) Transcript_70196:15-308(+)